MRWEDERYVRVYTRDTVGWKMLPWQAKCVLPLILRKLDRSGILDLQEHGNEGISALIDVPLEVVDVGMNSLLSRGALEMRGSVLAAPNFVEAQEAKQSARFRKAESRARARDVTVVTKRDQESHDVTRSHASGRKVTDGHERSRLVTPSLAEPSLAEPSLTTLSEQVPTSEQPVLELELTPNLKPKKTAEDLRLLWNALKAQVQPEAIALSPKRKKLAEAALQRRPWADIERAFRVIARADMCTGKTGMTWVATFDWALRPEGEKPEPIRAALEGEYTEKSDVSRNGITQPITMKPIRYE